MDCRLVPGSIRDFDSRGGSGRLGQALDWKPTKYNVDNGCPPPGNWMHKRVTNACSFVCIRCFFRQRDSIMDVAQTIGPCNASLPRLHSFNATERHAASRICRVLAFIPPELRSLHQAPLALFSTRMIYRLSAIAGPADPKTSLT